MLEAVAIVAGLFSLSTNTLVILTLIKRYTDTKIFAVIFILMSGIVAEVTGFLFVSYTIIGVDPYQTQFQEDFAGIALALFFAAMILFFVDYFENESLSLSRTVFLTTVVTTFITSGLVLLAYEPVLGGSIEWELLTGLVSAIPFTATIIFAIIGLRALQHCKQYAYDSSHNRQITTMQAAIVTYFILMTIAMATIVIVFMPVPGSESLQSQLEDIVSYTFTGIGNLLLYVSYARSTRVAFLQPQRMFKLIVINEAGLPAYSYSFMQTEDVVDDSLITAGISAVSSMLGHAIGAEGIKSVSFESHEMLISSEEKFAVVLFVERKSAFLHSAMDEFTKEFERKYGGIIGETVEPSTFKDAEMIVERSFGLAQE